MIVINQEADELLYRAAFAVEKTCYRIHFPNGDTKDLGNKYRKTDILRICAEKEWEEDIHYKITPYKEVEPETHALYLLKKWITRIKSRGDKLNLWLSPIDGSNFRFEKATIPGPTGQGYKAGRPPRPYYYQACRDYLTDVHGAQIITGYEADDALGIYQDKLSIASHIDKDINMIPGVHYNWVTDKLYTVTEIGRLYREKSKVKGDGFKFFCHQLLTGDRVDNIPAARNPKSDKQANFGPVAAMQILQGIDTKEKLLDKIKEVYYSSYKEDWQKELYERADLLWICRNENEIGSDILKKYYE